MIKKIVIIFGVMLLGGSLSAGEFSKVGTAGAQFLKIGVGSRYNGIGEAGVAIANDIYSMYWNPAGLTNVAGSEVAFTYVNYITAVSYTHLRAHET